MGFCFSAHVETNPQGVTQSSVSPAGINTNDPMHTAPKSVQKMYLKLRKKLRTKYEDRQVLSLRLDNLRHDINKAEGYLNDAINAWANRGEAGQCHMKLHRAMFAIKGVEEDGASD